MPVNYQLYSPHLVLYILSWSVFIFGLGVVPKHTHYDYLCNHTSYLEREMTTLYRKSSIASLVGATNKFKFPMIF